MSELLPDLPPPAADSPFARDWAQLLLLRQHPEVLAAARQATGNELQRQVKLRKQFPDELVRAALQLLESRAAAATKFSQADAMWVDRVGVEQSTSELVARHKAKRFRSVAGSAEISVLCAGIGGDAIALAEQGPVRAWDLNPAACLRTAWNADVYQVAQNLRVQVGDATELDLAGHWIQADPDRRVTGNQRAVRIEDYRPGLECWQRWKSTSRGGAIKISPAANFIGKFSDVEIELISLRGEAKEAAIWFGELRGENAWTATVLPAGETLSGDPLANFAPRSPLQRYLYDPDPAVVRSGLIELAAEQLELSRLDEEEEYLTAERLVSSPFVTPFEVLAELSSQEQEIRSYFRAHPAGQLEIKCRHIPTDAAAVRRKLTLKGSEPLVLFFLRIAGKSRAAIARRCPV